MSAGWDDPRVRGRPWRRIRKSVLDENRERNGGRCQLQLPPCTGTATQVHHVLGVRVTGHDRRYLKASCQACNLHVGDPMAAANPPPTPKTRWL